MTYGIIARRKAIYGPNSNTKAQAKSADGSKLYSKTKEMKQKDGKNTSILY